MKLIILDEVDNIHKREDAGGEGALVRLIKKKPRQPLILIANDPYRLSPELRNVCEMINFRRLTKNQIVKVLEKICAREGINADRKALEAIAENAGGDLRAAINDLQGVAEGSERVRAEDVVIAKRTQETDIFRILQKIFKTYHSGVYSEAMLLDESPEDIIAWVEENLPLEYSGEDLFKGYIVLSRADIFLGRVRRRQFYRMWKYASYLMTVGVQQIKAQKKSGFTRYKRPIVWQMLFRGRSKREKLKNILKKVSKYSHLSTKKANLEFYPYLKFLLENLEVDKAAKIAAFYDFSEDELVFIAGEKRAKEIHDYISEHKLHRIEDETFLKSFGADVTEREEEVEEAESPDLEEKREERRKKMKNLTLDSFFS
jgi:replication factor C large subunit